MDCETPLELPTPTTTTTTCLLHDENQKETKTSYVFPNVTSIFSRASKPTEQESEPKSENFEIKIEGASTQALTPNATIITKGLSKPMVKDTLLTNYSSDGRPLCILVSWLNAPPNGLKNYAKFYMHEGYDVLVLRFTLKEVVFPTMVDDILLNKIIPILLSCDHKIKIIHGFSVAGFVISRLMHHIEAVAAFSEERRYEIKNFMSTIKCQVWDSLVTYAQAKVGMTATLFPRSPFLQMVTQFILDMHQKFFYDTTARIFEEGDYRAHNIPIQVPALFFYSTADNVSTFEALDALKNCWIDNGVPCTTKLWTDSDHVMHMKVHTEEYQAILKEFLDKNII